MPDDKGVPEDLVPTASDVFARRVDQLFPEEVSALGHYAVELFTRLTESGRANAIPEREAVYPLLLNALTTAVAALELWRRGLLLQVGMLIRNALETIATGAVVAADRSLNELYREGRYESTRAFTDVKRTWPDVGRLLARASGHLSEEFIHVGPSYRVWHRITNELTESNVTALRQMLLPIKVAMHVLDQLSEYVCWETVEEPRYWVQISSNSYRYEMTEAGREFTQRLFKADQNARTKD